ncbi:hypothetical protein SARC_12572, partial [Sphaeroforma arctica JP610]
LDAMVSNMEQDADSLNTKLKSTLEKLRAQRGALANATSASTEDADKNASEN